MEHKKKSQARYTLADLMPLLVIFSLISVITLVYQWYYGGTIDDAMRIFMGSFFLVFGLFKVINIYEFAQAYAMYDIIAKRYRWYGYLYPFFELGLATAYLLKWNLKVTNVFTLILMLISSVGVFAELRKGKAIVCACMGTVFKVPMTYVTLGEDLLMAAMALIMLLW